MTRERQPALARNDLLTGLLSFKAIAVAASLGERPAVLRDRGDAPARFPIDDLTLVSLTTVVSRWSSGTAGQSVDQNVQIL